MCSKEAFEESKIREELLKLDERRNYLLRKLNALNVWQKKDNDVYKCLAIARIVNNLSRNDIDIDEKRRLLTDEVMKFCQKNRHSCYSYKEMEQKLVNVKEVLSRYKGDQINAELDIDDYARHVFLDIMYPKIEEFGPEDFVYHIDDILP